MGLFGKKEQKCSCGCGCGCDSTQTSAAAGEGAVVKILGSGCAKCNALEQNTKKALEILGRSADVEHVTDFTKIASYGVMTTPALVVDGKVIVSGRVPSAEQIADLLK